MTMQIYSCSQTNSVNRAKRFSSNGLKRTRLTLADIKTAAATFWRVESNGIARQNKESGVITKNKA